MVEAKAQRTMLRNNKGHSVQNQMETLWTMIKKICSFDKNNKRLARYVIRMRMYMIMERAAPASDYILSK